jgi:hypothetical protein
MDRAGRGKEFAGRQASPLFRNLTRDTLAKRGVPLKQMAKALTRSEESIKDRAKADGLKIAKLR